MEVDFLVLLGCRLGLRHREVMLVLSALTWPIEQVFVIFFIQIEMYRRCVHGHVVLWLRVRPHSGGKRGIAHRLFLFNPHLRVPVAPLSLWLGRADHSLIEGTRWRDTAI